MYNYHFNQNNQEDLRWAQACPICSAKYNPVEARVVEEREGAFLLHTSCKKCGSSVVATLIASPMGVSSIGMITDLTFDDVVKFRNTELVSANTVLDVYKFMALWNGSPKDLF